MKLAVVDFQKKKTGECSLPGQFQEDYRPDLIKRAVHAVQSSDRQPYGANPHAGLGYSSKTSKRRRDYRGTYGFGISRVARKILSRRGMRMFWVGATTPQTVGGRRSHPPKAEKIWLQHINAKENKKGLRSAISAVFNKAIVLKRGHKVPADYPFIVQQKIEEIVKTSELENILMALGFQEELQRSAIKKVRAGHGKGRGRKYQHKKGLLIVVSQECPAIKAAENIPGLDMVPVRALNAHLLAPGAAPGRITLWTEKAIEAVSKHNLFN